MVLLTLSGCGSCLDPFSKLTDCPKLAAAPSAWSDRPLGIYPASASMLNGTPAYFVGVKIHLN